MQDVLLRLVIRGLLLVVHVWLLVVVVGNAVLNWRGLPILLVLIDWLAYLNRGHWLAGWSQLQRATHYDWSQRFEAVVLIILNSLVVLLHVNFLVMYAVDTIAIRRVVIVYLVDNLVVVHYLRRGNPKRFPFAMHTAAADTNGQHDDCYDNRKDNQECYWRRTLFRDRSQTLFVFGEAFWLVHVSVVRIWVVSSIRSVPEVHVVGVGTSRWWIARGRARVWRATSTTVTRPAATTTSAASTAQSSSWLVAKWVLFFYCAHCIAVVCLSTDVTSQKADQCDDKKCFWYSH